MIFMANTGLRPDEANRLEYRDVTVVMDKETNQRILEIEVRGKRGVGYCKSMPSMRLRLSSGCASATSQNRQTARFPATSTSSSTGSSKRKGSSSTVRDSGAPPIACDTPTSVCA